MLSPRPGARPPRGAPPTTTRLPRLQRQLQQLPLATQQAAAVAAAARAAQQRLPAAAAPLGLSKQML